MNSELLSQLISVKNDLRELTEQISWECSRKTEIRYKKKVKALADIIKKIKAEMKSK